MRGKTIGVKPLPRRSARLIWSRGANQNGGKPQFVDLSDLNESGEDKTSSAEVQNIGGEDERDTTSEDAAHTSSEEQVEKNDDKDGNEMQKSCEREREVSDIPDHGKSDEEISGQHYIVDDEHAGAKEADKAAMNREEGDEEDEVLTPALEGVTVSISSIKLTEVGEGEKDKEVLMPILDEDTPSILGDTLTGGALPREEDAKAGDNGDNLDDKVTKNKEVDVMLLQVGIERESVGGIVE